eukprot:g11397.t1
MLRTSILKARQVRRRAVDWLALAGKVSTDGARTDVNRLRDLYDEINAAAKAYEGEPAPIDFAQYRKDIQASNIVDEFEVSTPYNSIVYPEIQLSEETIAEMNASMDKILADASVMREESVSRLAELESMIAEAEANKTTRDTTIDDVLARHPHIAKEIDDEIENHQWWKDVN